jgi:DNA-binding NarL/FixJ family response regulator
MKIILHSDDMLLLEYWEDAIKEKFTLIDDLDDLLEVEDSLVIVNYSAFDSSCEDILKKLKIKNNMVLVLHRVPNIETAKFVLKNGARGYGNALMREHFIVSAIETIKDGMIWLYPELTTMLIEEIPSTTSKSNKNYLKLELLSKREKQVAIFLKDGLTYKEIANELKIKPRTVKAHAGKIYKKLSVKDRLGLALLLK